MYSVDMDVNELATSPRIAVITVRDYRRTSVAIRAESFSRYSGLPGIIVNNLEVVEMKQNLA